MIKTVRIVDVIRAAENSKYGAQLVKVTHPNSKYEITAYAKELTTLDFLVELMTTMLARDLGIPMPEPVIVFSKDGKKYYLERSMLSFLTSLKGWQYKTIKSYLPMRI